MFRQLDKRLDSPSQDLTFVWGSIRLSPCPEPEDAMGVKEYITEKSKVVLPLSVLASILGGSGWMTHQSTSQAAIIKEQVILQHKIDNLQNQFNRMDTRYAIASARQVNEIKELNEKMYKLILSMEKRLSKIEGKNSM